MSASSMSVPSNSPANSDFEIEDSPYFLSRVAEEATDLGGELFGDCDPVGFLKKFAPDLLAEIRKGTKAILKVAN